MDLPGIVPAGIGKYGGDGAVRAGAGVGAGHRLSPKGKNAAGCPDGR